MRKLDGANGTKAHLKKQKSAETRDRRKTTKRRTKNLQTKAPTKVRYSRSTQKRKKSSSRVEEEVISSSFPHKSFFQKARARQKR